MGRFFSRYKRWILTGALGVLVIVGLGGFWRAATDSERFPVPVIVEPIMSFLGDKEPITLLFVGDIMLARAVGRKITQGGPRFPFEHIADTVRSADLAFGNLESPISSQGANQGSTYSFRADPKAAEGLAYAGFDVVSLANNHIWDWGLPALTDTIGILKSHEISPVGAGVSEQAANAPHIAEVKGVKVAFLAYTDLYPKSLAARGTVGGVSIFDEEKIKEAIAATKKEADIVVVSLHWGVEYAQHASSKQRQLAREFIDAGAALVIGHHPHVVQEVEQYKDGWIAYSLGNFVFDQSFSFPTMHGLMVRATIEDGKIAKFEELPVAINADYQPALIASQAEAQ